LGVCIDFNLGCEGGLNDFLAQLTATCQIRQIGGTKINTQAAPHGCRKMPGPDEPHSLPLSVLIYTAGASNITT
jgi:hypothetical protein